MLIWIVNLSAIVLFMIWLYGTIKRVRQENKLIREYFPYEFKCQVRRCRTHYLSPTKGIHESRMTAHMHDSHNA